MISEPSDSRRCLWARGGYLYVVYMQRLLAKARPPAGAIGQGLTTYKGAACGQGPLQRGGQLRPGPTRKGWRQPVAKPHGQPLEGGQQQLSARKGWEPPAAKPLGLLPAACKRLLGYRIVASPCVVISRHDIVGPAVSSTLPPSLSICPSPPPPSLHHYRCPYAGGSCPCSLVVALQRGDHPCGRRHAPASSRAGRGWQPLAGALQSV
ncbi:hypothetical protein B296_00050192, partial [Ensete ventricosum]